MRVLLTNDDGPPNNTISPFIYDFVQHLRSRLGWDVSVCVPSSQRSWIGKAYFINQPVEVLYANVKKDSTYTASTSRQPLADDEQEWILLDGTPATCTSIGLHNLFPDVDLVLSGPNLGRNTSAAFCLSSGTVGGAMAGAMSGVPSIAVSYGVFQKPYAPEIVEAAHHMTCSALQFLTDRIFAERQQPLASDVDVYSLNVPLVPSLLDCSDRTKPPIKFTSLGPGKYGRLFAPQEGSAPTKDAHLFEGTHTPPSTARAVQMGKEAGPSAIPEASEIEERARLQDQPQQAANRSRATKYTVELGGPLTFQFKPDIAHLVNPNALPEGSDIHAIHNGYISITPMKAAFALGQLPGSLADCVDPQGVCQF